MFGALCLTLNEQHKSVMSSGETENINEKL